MKPNALGWIDPTSPSVEWDQAQVRRLARRLGYRLEWLNPRSVLGFVEQVEASECEAVLVPSSAHLDAATLNRLLGTTDVECAAPRESFSCWSRAAGYRR